MIVKQREMVESSVAGTSEEKICRRHSAGPNKTWLDENRKHGWAMSI